MAQPANITSFTSVDQTKQARFYVDFLDAGNALPSILRLKAPLVELLRIGAGSRVLELACGTGDDARQLALLVSPGGGSVVGVDLSQAMIAEARRRHGSPGLPLEFVEGDARALSFPDHTFDAVRAERLLMHLDGDPARAIAEMARVTKPGGRIGVFDFDWDTMFVDHPDRDATRQIFQSFSDGMRHGWIGRSLRGHLRANGLADITVIQNPVSMPWSFFHRLLDGHLAQAVTTGMLEAELVTGWWSVLDRFAAEDRFFAGLLGFIVAGTVVQ